MRPFITEIRQDKVLTRNDLEGVQQPLREQVRLLQDHLRDVETRNVSKQELEALRNELREVRTANPPTQK
jgi:hypothetical protein